jgi:hypothetical protein
VELAVTAVPVPYHNALEAHSNPEIETAQCALDLQNLMNEEDVFKLSIRGQAAIDELLSHGIAEAFGGRFHQNSGECHSQRGSHLQSRLGSDLNTYERTAGQRLLFHYTGLVFQYRDA